MCWFFFWFYLNMTGDATESVTGSDQKWQEVTGSESTPSGCNLLPLLWYQGCSSSSSWCSRHAAWSWHHRPVRWPCGAVATELPPSVPASRRRRRTEDWRFAAADSDWLRWVCRFLRTFLRFWTRCSGVLLSAGTCRPVQSHVSTVSEQEPAYLPAGVLLLWPVPARWAGPVPQPGPRTSDRLKLQLSPTSCLTCFLFPAAVSTGGGLFLRLGAVSSVPGPVLQSAHHPGPRRAGGSSGPGQPDPEPLALWLQDAGELSGGAQVRFVWMTSCLFADVHPSAGRGWVLSGQSHLSDLWPPKPRYVSCLTPPPLPPAAGSGPHQSRFQVLTRPPFVSQELLDFLWSCWWRTGICVSPWGGPVRCWPWSPCSSGSPCSSPTSSTTSGRTRPSPDDTWSTWSFWRAGTLSDPNKELLEDGSVTPGSFVPFRTSKPAFHQISWDLPDPFSTLAVLQDQQILHRLKDPLNPSHRLLRSLVSVKWRSFRSLRLLQNLTDFSKDSLDLSDH